MYVDDPAALFCGGVLFCDSEIDWNCLEFAGIDWNLPEPTCIGPLELGGSCSNLPAECGTFQKKISCSTAKSAGDFLFGNFSITCLSPESSGIFPSFSRPALFVCAVVNNLDNQ